MADNHGDTVIKKVKKGGHGGHHGGAWKVAYADFVTAMMAFFLLLWLLNATTEEQKMGISNYFDPTAISRSSRSGSGGVLGGTSITVPGALKSPSSPPMVTLPVASRPQAEQTDSTEPDSDDRNTKGSEFGREDQPGQTGDNVAFTGQYDQKPGEEDGSIGQEDAYAGDRFGNKGGREKTEGELDQRGRPGKSGDSEGRPGDRGVAEGPVAESEGALGREGDAAGRADAGRDGQAQSDGKLQLGEGQAPPQGISPKELERLKAEREKIMFEQTAHELRQAIQANPELSGLAENLVVDQTPEGLRIQLVDQDRSAMFTSGSASMSGNARELMTQVARILEKLPDKKIVIAGHTDATPYSNQTSFSNWELSTERANASRRALLSAGLDPNRIGGIIGRADTDPLFPDQPFSPRNRRISIVVLYDQSKVADTGISGSGATPSGGPVPAAPQSEGQLERRASLQR